MEPVVCIPTDIQKVIDQINHMQTSLPKKYQVTYYIDDNGDVDVRGE